MVYTFSIPEKKPADIEKLAKINDYCKRKHLNKSSIIAAQLIKWAEAEGVFDEQRPSKV